MSDFLSVGEPVPVLADLLQVLPRVRLAFLELKLRVIGGKQVPVLLGRGPLRNDSGYGLVLPDGVGFLARQGTGNTVVNELVLWKQDDGAFADGVSLEIRAGGTGLLTLVGQVPGAARNVQAVMRFSTGEFQVRYLYDNSAPASGTGTTTAAEGALAAWPERIARWGDINNQWVYPDVPVRSEIWPYVTSRRVQGTEVGAPEWHIGFVGRRSPLRLAPSSSDPDRWVSIGELGSDNRIVRAAPLAIWPRCPIPNWRSYSVLLSDAGTIATQLDESNLLFSFRQQFWANRPGDFLHRSQLSHSWRNREVVHVDVPEALASEGYSPTFLVLDVDRMQKERASVAVRGGGVFGLLDEHEAITVVNGTPLQISLDFGTSTTVVAVQARPNPVPLDMMGQGRIDSNLALPKTRVRNHAPEGRETSVVSVKSRLPWLPTVPNDFVFHPDAQLVEVPTAVFDAFDLPARSEERIPFCDCTFLGNRIGLVDDIGRVHTDLKWEGFEGSPWSRAFLESILVWACALGRRTTDQFELRATYPLAFDGDKRKDYCAMLTEACQAVHRWTGIRCRVNPVWTTNQTAVAQEPYCDESTALLGGILNAVGTAQFQVGTGTHPTLKQGFSTLVFHADLGGGTLDLILATLKDMTNAKVLGAESIRFGADALLRLLDSRTKPLVSSDDPEIREPKLHMRRVLVGRAIRAGMLGRAMKMASQQARATGTTAGSAAAASTTMPSPTHLTKDIAWLNELVADCEYVKGWTDIYAALLVEYCARFLAGILLDDKTLQFRMARGPGPGTVNPIAWGNGVLVLVRWSGNGWKFMDALGEQCGWKSQDWQDAFKQRVAELVEGSDTRVPPRKCPEIQFEKDLLPKTATAIGALDLLPQVIVGAQPVPADCAPNGFNDADGPSQSRGEWWQCVGSGSLVASGTTPQSHRLFATKKHLVSHIDTPPLLGWGVRTPFRTSQAQGYWDGMWRTDADFMTRNVLENVRRAQIAAAGTTNNCRMMSTICALYEQRLEHLVAQDVTD